ncbi:hypothetical protein ACRRTK_004055 [Alexandromys fortis]
MCSQHTFQGRISVCNNPGCPRARAVDQAGLKLTEIRLLLPPECWDERPAPPPPSCQHTSYTHTKEQ